MCESFFSTSSVIDKNSNNLRACPSKTGHLNDIGSVTSELLSRALSLPCID